MQTRCSSQGSSVSFAHTWVWKADKVLLAEDRAPRPDSTIRGTAVGPPGLSSTASAGPAQRGSAWLGAALLAPLRPRLIPELAASLRAKLWLGDRWVACVHAGSLRLVCAHQMVPRACTLRMPTTVPPSTLYGDGREPRLCRFTRASSSLSSAISSCRCLSSAESTSKASPSRVVSSCSELCANSRSAILRFCS